MYSFPKLEPVCCSMSGSNCCFLTWIHIWHETGKVVRYSQLFKNFPMFLVILGLPWCISWWRIHVPMQETQETTGSNPGLGRSPKEGKDNLLQYPCLENPMDREAWSMGSQRVGHDWAFMHTHTHTHTESKALASQWNRSRFFFPNYLAFSMIQ